MNPSKAANLAEVERLMAEWSLLQRVRLIASLMHECTEASEPPTVEWSALGDILGETADRHGGRLPKVVTMRAYEVYTALYGGQVALVTGDCRGGFSTGEIIAFLYAMTFPRNEWRERVDEALTGMEHA